MNKRFQTIRNKAMNKFFQLIFLVLVVQGLMAQPRPVKPSMENEPEAEKYLKALQNKLNRLKSYKLEYKINTIDPNGKSSPSSGTYRGSGDKYSIETIDHKIICDGKNQWNINHEDKEIQSQKLNTKKSNTETPIGMIQNYQKLFKYRVKENLSNNKIKLELVPLNKNSPIFKIDMVIAKDKQQLLESKLYDRGGYRIQYTIIKWEENLLFSNSEFTLNKDKYKDYEEIDFR